MANIKKANKRCLQIGEGKENLIHFGGNANECNFYKNQYKFPEN
jgi:hypothetical protein